MQQISVPNETNDSLVAQLVSLYQTMKNAPSAEQIVFDLSKVTWFSPIVMLPLAALIRSTGNDFVKPPNASYLQAIEFPNGVTSMSELQAQIQKNKNYIPISVLERQAGPDRERLLSLFSEMIFSTLGSVPQAQNAVCYPISELVANIFDHSQADEGFIFTQNYPKKKFLDICITDRGRGLAQAYKDEKGLDLSDSEAITEVMKGLSTKPGYERGYGVRTSKRVVCEGLDGQFILISGSMALVTDKSNEKIVSLPDFDWQGVIIAYRIPEPTGPIDISQYIE